MSNRSLKPVFSYNADIEKNAYLNWRTNHRDYLHNMGVLAEGYRDSALYLANAALEDNGDKKADAIIFPILFNANHSIELYLKEILWCQHILLKWNRKIEGGHDIRCLFNSVSKRTDDVLKKYDFLNEKKKNFNTMMKNLKMYIEELYDKLMMTDQMGNPMSNMDYSRYPFSKDYQEHFYVKETENVVVDLENFVERFEEIGDNLDTLSGFFFDLVMMKAETDYKDREYHE